MYNYYGHWLPEWLLKSINSSGNQNQLKQQQNQIYVTMLPNGGTVDSQLVDKSSQMSIQMNGNHSMYQQIATDKHNIIMDSGGVSMNSPQLMQLLGESFVKQSAKWT